MHATPSRFPLIVVLLAAIPAAGRAAPQNAPIPPSLVTIPAQTATLKKVAAGFTEQTGIAIDLTGTDADRTTEFGCEKMPFWSALEALAETSGNLVAPGVAARIRLVPRGKERPRVAIDGPFRISAREVTARRNVESGDSSCDVAIELAWEPRFEVFRVDSQPTISKAITDAGEKLTRRAESASNAASGYSMSSTVRFGGVARKSNAIAELEGAFTVTASPAMLPFIFDKPHAASPLTLEQQGVKATLSEAKKDGALWTFTVALNYPPGGPAFESYQESIWLRSNQLTLVAPDGKRYVSDKLEIRNLSMSHRFQEGKEIPALPRDLKGWKVEYVTPAPLREYAVRFLLKDVPLP